MTSSSFSSCLQIKYQIVYYSTSDQIYVIIIIKKKTYYDDGISSSYG